MQITKIGQNNAEKKNKVGDLTILILKFIFALPSLAQRIKHWPVD